MAIPDCFGALKWSRDLTLIAGHTCVWSNHASLDLRRILAGNCKLRPKHFRFEILSSPVNSFSVRQHVILSK